jgi:hypothetical protein
MTAGAAITNKSLRIFMKLERAFALSHILRLVLLRLQAVPRVIPPREGNLYETIEAL